MSVIGNSLGYKPFLKLIQPQLQKLLESAVEPVNPESFQPVNAAKLLEPAITRMEERGGSVPLGLSLALEAPGSGPLEERAEEEEKEPSPEEGTYDCTLS